MSIVFSANPGCHERHLQRKYNNHLFAENERDVTQAQVNDAQALDEKENQEFLLELQSLLQDVGKLQANVETQIILDLKEKLDQLYETCAGLGGDHNREKKGMAHLNETIMRAIRSAAANDPLAIEELDKEQAAREIHLKLLEYKLVPHLLRKDSPITEQDLIPTLLSEDEDTVRVVMSLFDPEQQQQLRQGASALIEHLAAQGHDVETARANLHAMQAQVQ